ncbi:MAG: NifB/NifX family molybdenum-iron cluster-binding protein [Candidatus Nanoarchaeia archaeon]
MSIILIPTNSNNQQAQVCFHFGKASHFAIYNTLTKQIRFIKNIVDHNNPQKSAIAQLIEQTKATIILAGQIGEKAKRECKIHSCKICEGKQGNIQEIIKKYENEETNYSNT